MDLDHVTRRTELESIETPGQKRHTPSEERESRKRGSIEKATDDKSDCYHEDREGSNPSQSNWSEMEEEHQEKEERLQLLL